MSDDQGMIFQWNEDGSRAFWMENTYLPLDIVYVNRDKQIVSIKQAKPLTLDSVQSDAPASYAIELPMGWCKRHGISVGDQVDFSISEKVYFIAADAMHFGATPEEVEKAVADGNYNP
eukprot:CAMPEP_0169116150 /NCGR_PEP_ID=MMETSP1015-20121227/29726_1 /TAXON_ID=342587 /ORGANISM="Karlodinium micrum, Strain CCMP2283" /LENGTH=117 /DNA_ID=CAMNT_0009178657 /DNA_START=322 /DNA_END=672 /DNA_ORIENTATION=+